MNIFPFKNLPANIRLEDVLKTSFIFVFDEYVHLSLTSSEDVFKMSSRRLGQDQYIRLGYTPSRRLQDVFKTSSRRLQDVLPRRSQDIFKTSCKKVFKTSSRRLQEVLKTSSKRLQDVLQKGLQDGFKMYHQVKLFLLTRL